MTEKEF